MSMITAHSGCDQTEDNSLEFICYALKEEADCLEVDVRKWRDRLILSHDEAGMEEDNVVELRQVFELLRKHEKTKVNCDLKEADLEEQVYELAEEIGVAEQLIFTGSVCPDKFPINRTSMKNVEIYINIENVSEYFEQVYRGEKLDSHKTIEELEKVIMRLKNLDVCGLNVNHMLCTEEFLDCLQQNDIGCSAWTVNDIDVVEKLLDRKISNITTRNFARVQELRREKENAAV